MVNNLVEHDKFLEPSHCRKIAIKLRWSNDGQLGMHATDIIILAASQTCYTLSPGLHYNNVDSKQNLSICLGGKSSASHFPILRQHQGLLGENITIFLGFDSFADDAVVGGITLQSDLKWTQHANNIVANANKSLGFLKRNLKTSNTNIKSQANVGQVRVCSMSVTLLVLWYMLQAYLAARR
jgi:hypothetical protein